MSMMGDTNSKKYKIGYLPYENVIFSAENVMILSGLSRRNVTELLYITPKYLSKTSFGDKKFKHIFGILFDFLL